MPNPPIATSVVDGVVRRLSAAILDGTYPPGVRLPAERDLAAKLGVARVSVRAALRRLIEWGLVTTRQGSGALVQPRRAWTADALSHVLAHAMEHGHLEELLPLVRDGLELRRSLVLELVGRAAGRVPRGGLDATRAKVRETWAARNDMRAFIRLDRQILIYILEAAQMWPSLWLMNTLAPSYLAAIGGMAAGMHPPPSFESAHLALLDAIERGDAEAARTGFGRYLDDLDRSLVETLPKELAGLLFPQSGAGSAHATPPASVTPPSPKRTQRKK